MHWLLNPKNHKLKIERIPAVNKLSEPHTADEIGLDSFTGLVFFNKQSDLRREVLADGGTSISTSACGKAPDNTALYWYARYDNYTAESDVYLTTVCLVAELRDGKILGKVYLVCIPWWVEAVEYEYSMYLTDTVAIKMN